MFEEEGKKVSLQSKMADFNRLRRQKTISPRNQVVSLLVVAIITGSSFFLAQRITNPVYNPQKSSAAPVSSVRIMNVYYVPGNSPYASHPIDIFHLASSVRTYVSFGSSFHGDSANQVVSIDEVTGASYRTMARPIETDDDTAKAQMKTYKAILNYVDPSTGKSACQLVQENNLDQVWLWVDTNVDKAPGDEYVIVNPTSNYGNPLYSDVCGNSKSFVVLGLAYNSPVQNAVHSFGHYVEQLLTQLQGRDLFVERFQGLAYAGFLPGTNDYISSPIPPYKMSEKCGNVHTPPNIPLDPIKNTYPGYIYNFTNSVLSSCEYWNPDGTGSKVNVNVDTWLSKKLPTTFMDEYLPSPELSFLVWWMQNLSNESANLYFNGKKIPTWWHFVADTDNAIKNDLRQGYWMNPELHEPVAANTTSFCVTQVGATANCTFNTGSTLGASTENDQVLAATTYANLALVTVAYSPGESSTSVVSSVSYCGDAMTRVGTGPSIGGNGMKTEMWYKTAPKSGQCQVSVTFTVNPGQRIISSTIFNNIDQVNPVTGYQTGGLTGPYSMNPGLISATMTAPKDSLMLCTYSLYPEMTYDPGPNHATANTGTLQLWKYEQPFDPNNNPVYTWTGLGAGNQRLTDNQSTTLSWTTVKQQANSYSCTNLNVKPFATATPPPSIPPPPTPTTTVDLKVSNSNGPVTVPYNGSATLSWTTTNATGCTASGAWSGTKGTSGSAVLSGLTASGTYTLTCNGVADSVSVVVSPSTTSTLPTVDLRINGGNITFFDTSLKTLIAPRYTLSWTSSNATGCKINYGDWLGAVVNQPTSGIVALSDGANSNTWQLSCTGASGTATDVVRIVPTRGGISGIPVVGLFANDVDTAPYGGDNGVVRSLIIKSGQLVTLTWSAASATSCTATGSWTGAKAVTGGSQQMGAVTAAKTYTLTCTKGTYKTATSVKVTVK